MTNTNNDDEFCINHVMNLLDKKIKSSVIQDFGVTFDLTDLHTLKLNTKIIYETEDEKREKLIDELFVVVREHNIRFSIVKLCEIIIQDINCTKVEMLLDTLNKVDIRTSKLDS